MYVCVCNAINCRTVRQATRDGAKTVAAVFKVLGKSPQCGTCFATMRETMARETMARETIERELAARETMAEARSAASNPMAIAAE